ncbi:unnamed protein product [Chondrus crispus]|uniref:Uncharacterized protein n=1 Tax=Chondrus crispus TaxID=2769 RepID=R7Q9J6_CHOCR|nr:unnamed protein product [Chondrus crispus]CDF34150.1 unnamed protein product [Chondrus crispus]|eukprot:XP_005713969.1 unnamed protein product [Chondrus crispus]
MLSLILGEPLQNSDQGFSLPTFIHYTYSPPTLAHATFEVLLFLPSFLASGRLEALGCVVKRLVADAHVRHEEFDPAAHDESQRNNLHQRFGQRHLPRHSTKFGAIWDKCVCRRFRRGYDSTRPNSRIQSDRAGEFWRIGGKIIYHFNALPTLPFSR